MRSDKRECIKSNRKGNLLDIKINREISISKFKTVVITVCVAMQNLHGIGENSNPIGGT